MIKVRDTTFFCAVLLMLSFPLAENANILFFTPVPSYSHQVIFQPIWKELSLRGHKVTTATVNVINDKTLTNLTEIDLGFIYEVKKNLPKDAIKFMFHKPDFYEVFRRDRFMHDMLSAIYGMALENQEMQKLINSDAKFDVVIIEWLYPTAAALAAKFKCPLIGISSFGVPITGFDAIGNPSHPLVAPDHNIPLGKELSWDERLLSTVFSVYARLYYHYVALPKVDKTVKRILGPDMPFIGDIERNVSLLLLNRNPIFHRVMPILPNVQDLGGVIKRESKVQLNPEVKQFLDNSKNGVVYFSLGSNVLSSNLPDELIEKYISAFEQIPYNVLWKWETDKLPRQPKNVFIHKWLPQTAVLAHPNVKLFMTQGGLQSMEETITYHVPIIGMPSHSDQTMNVDTAVKYGFGIGIDFDDLTVDKLKKAIMEIMTNDSYKENVKKIEKLMNDVPTNGLEKAIWWIEYVIRHKGAKHLRSPAMDIPWYQYLLLDVMALIFSVLFLLLAIIYVAVKMTIKLCKSIMSKTKKTKKE